MRLHDLLHEFKQQIIFDLVNTSLLNPTTETEQLKPNRLRKLGRS